MSIKSTIYKFVPRQIKAYRQERNSTTYNICKNFSDKYKKIYHIKDATWEHVHMPEVYQMMKSWECSCFFDEQDILEVPNAKVCLDADYVIADNECIWDKAYQENFSKIVPTDNGLRDHDRDIIVIRNPRTIVKIDGPCISMLGVHASIWSHFITQFLPKLYYAEEAGLLDQEVSVLIPDYKDSNIKELVDEVLNRHKQVKCVCCADKSVWYECGFLYYIPASCALGNHAMYEAPFDSIVPERVCGVLRRYVVEPRISNTTSDTSKEKLYLVRRATYRGLTNYEEIEDYFKEQGFYFVEPHLLSLQEKASLFRNAKIIVGPASAAWSNTIFCDGGKGLYMNTLARMVDPYTKYLMQIGKINGLQLTGWDHDVSGIHSSYTIPLGKVKAAYEYLLRME